MKSHEKLIKLVEDLGKPIRPILFAQFTSSSLLLCMLGFQLLKTESFEQRFISLFYGSSVLYEIFIYSLGGQLIRDKSMAVVKNFYEIDKDFMLIIARAQKPLVLSAWFFKADLSTFQQILNATGSFIALLKSMID